MPVEQISPELVLVDPDLAARARAALPYPGTAAPARPTAGAPAPAAAPAPGPTPAEGTHGRYPAWARIAALLWVLVVGILIGGAAIPHAKERPTLVPPAEDVTFCERPQAEPEPTPPQRPLGPIGGPGSP